MKTFITVSIDRKDLVKKELIDVLSDKIDTVVTSTLCLMADNHLVQLKITNLPPMKEDT